MSVRHIQIAKTIQMALLIAGSAFCICSCGRSQAVEEENNEGLMTQEAYNLTRIESTNGKLSNKFETPLMEEYAQAREPYRECRRGIKVTTYNSETNEIESTLIADYAIEFVNQQLFEAKGNVVVTNANGHVLETQQLFWNRRTGRIYSNIDFKITQNNDVMYGVGFESDEAFRDWELRRTHGTADVDVDSARGSGEGAEEADPESGDAPDDTVNTIEANEETSVEPSVAEADDAAAPAPAPTRERQRPEMRIAPESLVPLESLEAQQLREAD